MKKGFTLAEVLITLGIIGVVAAMTIPTLVADYQAKSWSTSASVFERKLEEALKVMNTQQTLAGYTTTEDFVNELKKHIKIIKTCNNDKLDECFPKEFLWGSPEPELEDITLFTNSTKLRFESPYYNMQTNTVGIQFANGVAGVLAYNPNCKQDPYSNSITGTDCISMIYDTSGFKSPNQSGKDIRSINSNRLWAVKINGTKYTAAFNPQPLNKQECNDFFNEDFCFFDNDYWAGALATCGSIDNLPYHADDIVEYLYEGRNCRDYNVCINKDKASLLNLKENYTYLWIGYDDDNEFAQYVDIYNGGYDTHFMLAQRNSASFKAICVVD